MAFSFYCSQSPVQFTIDKRHLVPLPLSLHTHSPQTIRNTHGSCLGHVFLQELIQISSAVAVVEHNANGLIVQAGAQQLCHVRVLQSGQVTRLRPEVFLRVLRSTDT